MEVILIAGRAQHGKDTFAGFLRDALTSDGHSVCIMHYADLLKFVCTQYLGWSGAKDESGRSLLQRVGTDVVRAQDPDFWVDFVTRLLGLLKNEWDYVLIPDCRFPNECDKPKELFPSVTVKIVRKGFKSPLTAKQRRHPSETALNDYEFDETVRNDGDLCALREKAIRWVVEHTGAHQTTFDEL